MEQVEQASSRKPFPKGRITLLITCIVSVIFSLAIIQDYSLYQSYVQSYCTITSASVIAESHSKSPETYDPYYEFTVYTLNGQPYASNAFLGEYNTYDEANAALPQYAIGSNYQCWYNPADPTRAGLTHAPYPFGLALLYTALIFVGYFLGIGLVLVFVVYLIFPALYLLMRGQRTTGTVVGHIGSGRSRRARVSYSIADRAYELNASASTPIGKTVTVLFDPRGVFKSVIRSGTYWNIYLLLPVTLFMLGALLYLAYWSWFLAV